MTIDERRIAEELRLMATEATPVDPSIYVARARTSFSRRRFQAWSLAGSAVLAAATVIALVIVPSSEGPGADAAARVQTLPPNTPEQLRLIRECMPQGGPVHNMDGGRRVPAHGSAEDFRVLTEYRDQAGTTAMVGSDAGYVLCTPTRLKEMEEHPLFTYWGLKAPGNLAGFVQDLQVDAHTSHTYSYLAGKAQKMDVYRVVAGRVGDAVRRVEVDWADGRRTEARMANGFFIVRIIGKQTADPEGRKDALDRPLSVLVSPPVTVTAYGEDGRVLQTEKDVAFTPLGSS